MQNMVLMSPFAKDKAGVHPGESAQRQWPWETVATLTAAEAALAGDKLNSTYLATLATTKVGIYSPMNGQVAFEVRGRTDGTVDNDVNVTEMYAAAKDLVADLFFYRRIATLTWSRGTGEYWPTAVDPAPPTIWFCDELAVTNSDWLSDTNDVGVDASQDYATFLVNCHGYVRFAFIMSTKDANVTTHYVDVRRM